MLRFHIVSNPYIPPLKHYCTDAFTNLSLNFSKMMFEHGHQVYFYGVSGYSSDVICTKYVEVMDKKQLGQLSILTDNFTHPELFTNTNQEIINQLSEISKVFAGKVVNEVEQRCQNSFDIVVHIFEPSIKFKKSLIQFQCCHMGGFIAYENNVFVTHDYFEACDKSRVKTSTIIYPWLDPSDYVPASKKREKTLLYMARCSRMKGLNYFLDFSQGLPDYEFIVSGNCIAYDDKSGIMHLEKGEQVDFKLYPNVKYIGIVRGVEKYKLLAEVTALVQPTPYREPCGINVLEAMMCGTPVLTTNFGGFVNTVKHGLTGYLCGSDEWIDNIKKLDQIKGEDCRKHAILNFTETIAYDKYMAYIDLLRKKYQG